VKARDVSKLCNELLSQYFFKVSWVRRKSDQLDLLTLGIKNHSSDPRFQSAFKYPNNWRLAILNATRKDSGTYLCQISTHPPKVLEVQLTVEGIFSSICTTSNILLDNMPAITSYVSALYMCMLFVLC